MNFNNKGNEEYEEMVCALTGMGSYLFDLKNLLLDLRNRPSPPTKSSIEEPLVLELKELLGHRHYHKLPLWSMAMIYAMVVSTVTIGQAMNLNSSFELWNPGVLSPSLIAFKGHVHRIDHSWHIAYLGYQSIINVIESILKDGAVIYFSEPAKPWLEIGSPEMRSLWNRHVNLSNEFISKCRIVG
ncbi:hypothetical protein FXO37_26758 [Capsicum annuum]|nr:hypothetical protein FXO37_26758 [Capsicum annuum]